MLIFSDPLLLAIPSYHRIDGNALLHHDTVSSHFLHQDVYQAQNGWYLYQPNHSPMAIQMCLLMMNNLAYLCLAFATAWFFIAVVIILSHCRPLEANWGHPLEDPEFCFRLKPYQIYMSSSGLILDAIIWSLPHHVVWQLQLRRAHKIAITSTFALGLLYQASTIRCFNLH
jgi:hypothetical protein